MWRTPALKILRALNRLAKRALGVEVPMAALPPPPAFMVSPDFAPIFSDDARPGTVVFILPNFARGQGGMADVLHLGLELEKQVGVQVFFTSTSGIGSDDAWQRIHWTHPGVRREQVIDRINFIPDILCATAWPTAYEVCRQPSRRKLYFIQDYEPLFHRGGLERHYAERTYGLGLEMFTLGPWLAHHIAERHGISRIAAMPFPVTDAPDPGVPPARRDAVAFYVQPDKEHRGTPLMLETARRMAAAHPGLRLVLFGSHDNEYLKLDFPCEVLGLLSEGELRALFRRTRLGVCASFTNVSLVTFRFMVHGCLTLDLDLPNVRMNVPACAEPLAGFAPPDPASLVAEAGRMLAREMTEDVRMRAVGELGAGNAWSACAKAVAGLFVSREGS